MFLQHQIDIAIQRLKGFEPDDGYYLAFSGGKDSIVIKQLAIEAGVKFDAHYNNTTIDPPDLIYYMREHHSEVEWNNPKIPFLRRLPDKIYPSRYVRWCCDEYKEGGGDNRIIITGVRWAESAKRSKRRMMEQCYRHKSRTFLNVIIDWSDEDVWSFIHDRNLPYCSLYDEGWKRIGCLFCPMTTYKNRRREADKYPRYYEAFRKAFHKLYENKKHRDAFQRWGDGDEFFNWWFNDAPKVAPDVDDDQVMLFE